MMLVPAPGSTLGTWTVGDIVVGPFAVPYEDGSGDGGPADLTGYTVRDAYVTQPDGVPVPTTATITDPAAGIIEIALPASPVSLPGIYQTRVVLEDAAGNRTQTSPVPHLVEAKTDWLTCAQAREGWRDAPSFDVQLWRLLNVARTQVVEWGLQPTPTPVPDTYVAAQATQARNIWNAVKTDPANAGIGDEALLLRPFPLDWTVKQMIRPKSPRPVVR